VRIGPRRGPSGGGHFDERGSDGGRARDRLACLPKTVEVEGDRLPDQPLHLLLRVADHADAGEVETEPYQEGDLTVAVLRDPSGNLVGVWQRG
jgi:hypothetical protein